MYGMLKTVVSKSWLSGVLAGMCAGGVAGAETSALLDQYQAAGLAGGEAGLRLTRELAPLASAFALLVAMASPAWPRLRAGGEHLGRRLLQLAGATLIAALMLLALANVVAVATCVVFVIIAADLSLSVFYYSLVDTVTLVDLGYGLLRAIAYAVVIVAANASAAQWRFDRSRGVTIAIAGGTIALLHIAVFG